MGLLTSAQQQRLLEIMKGLPGMEDPEMRKMIASVLPPSIYDHIHFSRAKSTDLNAIIITADRGGVQLAGGTWPIELIVEKLRTTFPELKIMDEITNMIESARADRAQPQRSVEEAAQAELARVEEAAQAKPTPLDPLQPLQRQVTSTLRYLGRLIDLLEMQPHPTERRLRRVKHTRALQDTVLSVLIYMRYEHLGSNQIPREQAVRQLDTARRLARNASAGLDACQLAVGELLLHVPGERLYAEALDQARRTGKEAHRQCSQLREHLRCWARECQVYTRRAA